jgi:HEAT repeat protein
MGIISENVLHALVDVLHDDPDQRVRAQAALALCRLKAAPEFVINALYSSLRDDKHLEVRLRAAEALANIGRADENAIDLLVASLNNPEGAIRSIAAKALRNVVVPSEDLIQTLLESLRRDTRLDVRSHVSDILGRIGKTSPNAVTGLIKVLNDARPLVRASAIDAIGEMGISTEQVIRPLLTCLEDSDYTVRDRASAALSKLAAESSYVRMELEERTTRSDQTRLWAAEALGRAGLSADTTIIHEEDLRTGEWRDRLQAIGAMKSVDRQGVNNQMIIDALAEILAKEPRMSWNFLADGASIMLSEVAKLGENALRNVTRLLQNNSWVVKMVTAKALGLTGKPEDFVVKELIQVLQHDPDDHTQGNAATSLGVLIAQDEVVYARYHSDVVDMLQAALRHHSSYVRVAAAQALGSLGARNNHEVIKSLENLLEDQETSEYHGTMVRDAAFEALWKLGPYGAVQS